MAQVKILFEENSLLEEDNKKLISLYRQERNHICSSGKNGSTSAAKVKNKKDNSFLILV